MVMVKAAEYQFSMFLGQINLHILMTNQQSSLKQMLLFMKLSYIMLTMNVSFLAPFRSYKLVVSNKSIKRTKDSKNLIISHPAESQTILN